MFKCDLNTFWIFSQILINSPWRLNLKRKNSSLIQHKVRLLKPNTHRPPVWWCSGSHSCGFPSRPVWRPVCLFGSAHTSAGWTGWHKARVWFGSDCVWHSSILRCRTRWCHLREAGVTMTHSPHWIRCSQGSNHKVGCQALQQTIKLIIKIKSALSEKKYQPANCSDSRKQSSHVINKIRTLKWAF